MILAKVVLEIYSQGSIGYNRIQVKKISDVFNCSKQEEILIINIMNTICGSNIITLVQVTPLMFCSHA